MAEDTDKEEPLCCTFCGKGKHMVKKLIAGPTVFICNECVVLCMDILQQDHLHDPTKSEQEIIRQQRQDTAAREMAASVGIILAQEAYRHQPYMILQKAFHEFTENTKKREEVAPQVNDEVQPLDPPPEAPLTD